MGLEEFISLMLFYNFLGLYRLPLGSHCGRAIEFFAFRRGIGAANSEECFLSDWQIVMRTNFDNTLFYNIWGKE